MSTLELQLKISIIEVEMRSLQKTCDNTRVVMRQASDEITSLREENELLKAQLRFAELRNVKRAQFGTLPVLLMPQAE